MNAPRSEDLRKIIPSLLSGLKGIISTSAIVSIVSAETASVQETLAELEEDAFVCRRHEHHVEGWTVPDIAGSSPGTPDAEKWLERLCEYVLSSPGATLPEIITALESGQLSMRDRVFLILGGMRQAREYGEFRLLSHFLSEIMRPEEIYLTVQEAGEVLSAFEPRKLRNVACVIAVAFIERHLSIFESPRERAMALTRLGELELLENRLLKAEEHLKEALELSMETNTGEYIPAILSSMAEIPRDFEGIKEMAARVERVIDWLPRIHDNDVVVRILATAATVLAGFKMNAAADRTILSAMTHVPVVTPETQQILEWNRAKVYIASGRRKTAMTILQRALLLAESVNDQLAVMEILNIIVFEMKERPGYSIRSLISIMRSALQRASTSGTLSNRLYALDHLADMYTRTLQVGEATAVARRVSEIVRSSEMLRDEPRASWCEAYLGFLTGDERCLGGGDLLLPGTDDFLRSLAEGTEPVSGAGMISDYLLASSGSGSVLYALILALEAYSWGFERAHSIIATALDSSYSKFSEDPFPSWKLCISGLLASKDSHADDFFQSAQILARQLDSLLLVWLLLRCRMKLSLDRSFREDSRMSLMLAELDEHIAGQLPGSTRDEFMERTGADRRLGRLRTSSSCPKGTLREIRDSLSDRLEDESIDAFRKISGESNRISSRSEISASLEAMGLLASADRILALRIKDSNISIIEGYGPGSWRLPCIEAEEVIRKFPGERITIDNFGKNPFGSRRYMIIPAEKSVVPPQMQRRLDSHYSQRENYLLIEMDTPYDNIGRELDFFIESLSRQVSSALLLRDRESMAYIDTLTGSVIGYSWTQRLQELTDDDTSTAIPPLSVLLVDVDGLREINRLFGYKAGDGILKSVVSTIKGVLRPNDMIGRFREDLFGVFLPETGEESAMIIAERICGVIASAEIRPDRVPVTVCIGTASYSSSADSSELVITRASAALNMGKSRGGNMAVYWSAEEEALDPNSGVLTLFNTGDPGWDHSVSVTLLELLTTEKPSLELLAERLRNAMRSEFVYLEDGMGNSSMIGSKALRKVPQEIHEKPGDGVCTHFGILGFCDTLSVRLACGGRLISAWDSNEIISGSLKNVFRALAALADHLIQSGSVIPGHPPPERL
ncbi:MAG: GGDEF domain-containing protein [Candidatus Aegiribacteria sp.]|nr:GGDEF domain-containing protein [Candidatus Aegiribacteria sp.]